MRGWPARLLFRLRHPQTTVRWRLTLLYGSLFLICGAGLLAITYTLLSQATSVNVPFHAFGIHPPGGSPPRLGGLARSIRQATGPPVTAREITVPPAAVPRPLANLPPRLKRALASNAGQAAVGFVVAKQRVSDLHHLEVESGIALAVMALVSGLLGWVMAGRVLRPLRTMTVATQQISEVSLDRRLAMPGPRDELRQLADTIDGLLGRLERAFDAQRQFVANASHELRTPLTAARALLEMVLSDPRATVATFRETCQHVLSENEHQEHLIDALLTLAQSQRGLDRRESVDLESLVSEQAEARYPQAAARALDTSVSLEPARVYGDRRLLERLVSNLLENAIRHNIPSGRLEIRLAATEGGPVLRVSNSGPEMTPEETHQIVQPFQRMAPDRTTQDDGLGLGLSIVSAIASAHNAQLDLAPRAGGGLEVVVRFPAPPALDEPESAGGLVAAPDAHDTAALELARQ